MPLVKERWGDARCQLHRVGTSWKTVDSLPFFLPAAFRATPLAMSSSYSVEVESVDFKFAAAHFVAYAGFREKLHGRGG